MFLLGLRNVTRISVSSFEIQHVSIGDGFKDFLCSPRKLGKMNPFDEHIFHTGWFHHQLGFHCIRNYSAVNESNDIFSSMGTITYPPPKKKNKSALFESMIFPNFPWKVGYGDSFPGGFAQVEHQVIQFVTFGGHPIAELLIGWSSLVQLNLSPHSPKEKQPEPLNK